ncbi:uncharacterized protein EAE97_000372 [Botrytis byssoidea]|uniref:RING-type domain-containing protein n=1 Tax=Botrytis byssoidea TaxID=139641 RepID=A0A9P5IYQ6_9HELO|nr:uncharacterized protein EAE97_000372 [Botrytis byssoidea]KAF7955113.1 hypothetical protein EAE97_000372 [Botrytis byssoidea]
MDNQQEQNNSTPPNTPPGNHIIRQRRENRLAAARGDALPFPNISYPLGEEEEDNENPPNIAPPPANLPPTPLFIGPIASQNLRIFPHTFNLLMHYDQAPHLPVPALHFRNRIVSLLNGVEVPWPMHDELPPDLLPRFFPDLELSAVREIQAVIWRAMLQRSRVITRTNAPNTPSWILGLFPDESPLGQRDANGVPICPICMQELPARVSIVRPCEHRFCPGCLEEWIPHANLMNPPAKCPVCFVEIRVIGNNGEVGHRVGEFLGWNFEGEGPRA